MSSSKSKRSVSGSSAKNGAARTPPAPSVPVVGKSPKFYDGPTVRRVSDKAATPPPATSKKAELSSAVVRTTKTKKRRGCSVLSLVTLVPLLFIFSLFSTLLCPPPSHPQSQFSRLAFNSFGLGKDQHSSLHQTLCYPAYQYHDKVLEPYVYPALEDVQAKIQAHPVYTDKLEPGYQAAKATAERVWNGPVKPVVDRIARGARKFHLTHIQPRLPYLRAKLNELTAPVAHRLAAARAHVCAQYKTHAAPHVKVAAKNAQALYAQAEAHFHTAAGHPLTKQAGRHAHTAFRVTKDHSHKAYVFSKPHVVRGWHFTAHHSQHTVLPRVAQGLEIAADYMTRGLRIVKSHVLALYNAHLAAHVDPYLLKAQAALAPYHAVFEAKVYQPYVKPFLVSVLPAAVVPEPKKSYWSFVTDRLPGQKGNKTEKPKAEKPKPKAEKPKAKEQAKDVKPKAEKVEAQKPKEQPKVEKPKAEPKVEKPKAEAQQPKPEVVVEQPKVEIKAEKTTKEAPKEEPKVEAAKVAEPSTGTPVTAKVAEKVQSVTTKAATQSASTTAAEAETTASVAAATEPEPEAAKDHKADIVATLAELKRKLDFQAKASYGKLQSEIVKEGEHFASLVPEMIKIGSEALDREMNRMITGLDRLYSNSKQLTREQVSESIKMSDKKVGAQHKQARDGIATKKSQLKNKVMPAVQAQQKAVSEILGSRYEALGKQMSIVDDVTSKEWGAYKTLRKDADSWIAKLGDLADKSNTKALKELEKTIQTKVNEANTVFDDLYEGFRTAQLNLKKVALERIAAREAMQAEQRENKKQAPLRAAKPKPESETLSAEEGRVSILPIEDEKVAAGEGVPVIGKDKVQVEEALKKAQEVREEERAKVTARPVTF